MKNNLFKVLLSVICMAGILVACNDDDYNGPSPDEITANYSNKLAVGDRANLDLTYSGREFIGKEVNFNTSDSKTATITLKSILPGEVLTPIENVQLTADGNNGYTFSGNATGTSGTTFNYQGVINNEKLALTLSDIKQPANQLAQHGTFYPVQKGLQTLNDPEYGRYTFYQYAFHIVSDDQSLIQSASLLEGIVGNLLTWFVSSITFNPDGNITAQYAPGLPEGKAITDLLFPNPNRPESDWVASPLNLASYYVKDDSLLYVVPNIDMIIKQIENGKGKTKASVDSILTEQNITAIYQKIQQWTNEGIKFTIRQNSEKPFVSPSTGKMVAYKGDIFLFIDKNEIKEFLPLLPLVKELIPEDMMSGVLGGIIGNLLNGIINGIGNSNTLELGLMLTKEKDIPDPQTTLNALSLTDSLSPVLNDKSKSN